MLNGSCMMNCLLRLHEIMYKQYKWGTSSFFLSLTLTTPHSGVCFDFCTVKESFFFPFEVNFLILSLWFWYAYVSISLGCLCCVGLLFTLSDCWGCFCKRALMHSESVQDWQQLKRRKKNQQLSATSGDYISTLFCATSWMQLGNHVSVK